MAGLAFAALPGAVYAQSDATGPGAVPANDATPRPLPLAIAAHSPDFLPNGVALTSQGDIFLSLPRWTGMENTISVARVSEDGSLAPFPGGAWNQWKPGDDGHAAFVMINALHIFGDDTLWVVDQGTADRKTTLPGAQKLLQFDTASGKLLRSLCFGPDILPEGAQMNDLRLWAGKLYIPDSGLGAIIVHDLATGHTMRRLAGNPLLRQEPGRSLTGTGGRPLEDAEGHRPAVQIDQVEVSAGGRWFYFCTPTGPLRRLPLAMLGDASLEDARLAAAIETVGDIPCTNGTAADTAGNLYIADAEQRRILLQTPSGQRLTLLQDERLVSADAMFIDRRRLLYIPCPQTEKVADNNRGQDAVQKPFLVLAATLPTSFGGHALGDAIAPGEGHGI